MEGTNCTKEDKKTVVIIVSDLNLCYSLVSAEVPHVEKIVISMNENMSIRKAKDLITNGVIHAVVITLDNDIVKKPLFTDIVHWANSKKIMVILVHPDGVQFPSSSVIGQLEENIRHVFDKIAVPFSPSYADNCWKEICHKLNNNKPMQPFRWFFSHRQSDGQAIVLPLYYEFKELGETAFLDIKAPFELHNLEKLVEQTSIFLFVLTADVFKSEYCHKELTHAIKQRKPIVVMRDHKFTFTSVPPAWKQFEKLLCGPRTILYSPKVISECAAKLKDIRINPTYHTTDFYKPEDTEFYPEEIVEIPQEPVQSYYSMAYDYLSSWIYGKEEVLEISQPRNFRHALNIGWNSKDGIFESNNIPSEWKIFFEDIGIQKSDLENKEIAGMIAQIIQDSDIDGKVSLPQKEAKELADILAKAMSARRELKKFDE